MAGDAFCLLAGTSTLIALKVASRMKSDPIAITCSREFAVQKKLRTSFVVGPFIFAFHGNKKARTPFSAAFLRN